MNPSVRNLLAAASAAIFLAVVLPLQTFIPNVSNYDFGIGRLVFGEVLVAGALGAVLYLLLGLLDRFLRGYLMPVVAALAVCVYLEAGPLSFGIPELNGELPAVLDQTGRKVADGLVWVGLLLAAVGTYRWTRSWLHWVPAVVLILGLSSLLDVRVDGETVDAADVKGGGALELADDLIEAVEYSPTRNVLMFVLDSAPASLTDMVVDANPDIKSHFPGFTAYRNNIGMHARTRLGVPGIMTGVYYENGQDVGEYMMTSLGTNSLLQVYRDRGDAIYSMLDFMAYGFVDHDLPKRSEVVSGNESLTPVLWRDAMEIPGLSVGSVTIFRLIPFAFKDAFLTREMRVRRNRGGRKGYDRESVLGAFLASRPISQNPRQMFAKFHTHGMHGPLACPTIEETVSNCLMRLARLMDVYRERGLYDKSFIVIAGDHGSGFVTDAAGGDRKASAMLWVKPEGDTSPYGESAVPTSHSKIAALMKRVASEKLSAKDVETILYTKNRLYRRYFREDGGCREWIYGPDGKLTKDSPEG